SAALPLSDSRVWMPWPSDTRPSLPSGKQRTWRPPSTPKRVHCRGRFSRGTENVLRLDWPTETSVRPRIWRSSMSVPPRTMATRSVLTAPEEAALAGDWLGAALMSEGCLPHRVDHLGKEVLLEGLPLVVDARGLEDVDDVRLVDL